MKPTQKKLATLVLSAIVATGQFLMPAVPVALLGGVVVTQTACPSSDSISKIAGEVERYTNGAITIFRANGQSTTRLEQVASLAGQVKTAFQGGGDVPNGVELVSRMIDAFKLVTNDANAITDPTTRTVVLVALWVVGDQLDRLAEKMEEEAPAAVKAVKSASVRSSSVNKIAEFRVRRRWACRNSSTGQFEKLEFCQKNPAGSQVETY